MSKVVQIDGSYLEGGGQILRNALSLSCILQRPVRIYNIRANRPNPGLSNQHLFGLNLLQQITNASVSGNQMKSTVVEFAPQQIKSGKYMVDTRTAASVTLVLQAALPVLLFAQGPLKSSELDLIGGTNVGMAPQVDFMTEVMRPNLELFGASFDFDLVRRGYYPKGGGCCRITVPVIQSLNAVEIVKFGNLQQLMGWCFVAGNIPPRIAYEMKSSADAELRSCKAEQGICIEAYKEAADMARDNGSGLILKAISTEGCTVGSSALGERKVDGKALALAPTNELKQYISNGTCVDGYVQDQLIIFMALAKGVSRIKTCALTNHTKTAIHVAELLTGVKFKTETEADGVNVIIECEGIGHLNKD